MGETIYKGIKPLTPSDKDWDLIQPGGKPSVDSSEGLTVIKHTLPDGTVMEATPNILIKVADGRVY